ncbi:MAG: YidC/Oxa1 family membrane protein insertase [Patescibacteria group bacterium]
MFATLFHNPIYNLFVLILDFITSDVGIAIILMTIIIKLLLFPLAKQSIKTQIGMKKIKPELDLIQKKYGKKPEREERQKMAVEMMELYRANNVRPFSSFFMLLIQLPVLVSLYWIFYKAGLPEINTDILYSFVQVPAEVSMSFLGFIDLSAQHNLILALLAGAIQGVHSYIAIDVPERTSEGSAGAEFTRNLMMQMKYGLPLLIAGTAYYFGAVIALYLITSTLFMLFQEYLVRKEKAELKSS